MDAFLKAINTLNAVVDLRNNRDEWRNLAIKMALKIRNDKETDALIKEFEDLVNKT